MLGGFSLRFLVGILIVTFLGRAFGDEVRDHQTSILPERLDFRQKNFFLKENYISRDHYQHFDDRGSKDECQNEVYQLAHTLALETACYLVGDVGCGSGFKLMKFFIEYQTIGFEIEPTLTFLHDIYPHRQWLCSDFQIIPPSRHFDILICADVIEHLENPDDLLNWINTCQFNYFVISTPDRDFLEKMQKSDFRINGPPVNGTHLREWNFEEFETYLSQFFKILKHVHTEKEYWGQVIIAQKK